MTADVVRGKGFRQSMSGLHTWGGLLASWLLFVVFLTGTLAVFHEPISEWMTPERMKRSAALSLEERLSAVRHGQAHLEKVAPKGHYWSLGVPHDQDPDVRLSWEDDNQKHGNQRLDAWTGASLPPPKGRETAGGYFFITMHHQLHLRSAGTWIVGFLAMAMLTLIVSGVAVHKRIFKDFFTFRPKKGQRSWLDGHNALGVLTLPFQFMIAYTGLTLIYGTYMPAGIAANFPSEEAYHSAIHDEPPEPEETGIPAKVTALAPLLQRAEGILGGRTHSMLIEHPGDSSVTVKIFMRRDMAAAERSLPAPHNGHVLFDGKDGRILHVEPGDGGHEGFARGLNGTLDDLHEARFGGIVVKWLYFVCGLAGAALISTGAILFMVKRRQKALGEFGAYTAQVYRGIEVLNVASIAGCSVACIALFWANRLIPVDVLHRATWEHRIFFAVWALSLLHAALRPHAKAWAEQLAMFATLCLLLPMLNRLTTGDSLISHIAVRNWSSAGVEIVAVAFGAAALWVIGHIRRRASGPPARMRRSTGAPALQAAE